MGRKAGPPPGAEISPYHAPAFIPDAIAKGNHRAIIGGRWDETGIIQMRVLLAEGLRPHLPISVLLLGMGADMHTASLFPGADRLEEAAHHVVHGLPAAAIVEAGPGGDRPGVVELPVNRAHAMGFQRAPVFDGGLDGEALLDLRQEHHLLEV